jgi:hypothetical protein
VAEWALEVAVVRVRVLSVVSLILVAVVVVSQLEEVVVLLATGLVRPDQVSYYFWSSYLVLGVLLGLEGGHYSLLTLELYISFCKLLF